MEVGDMVIAEILYGLEHGRFVEVPRLIRYHDLFDRQYRLNKVCGRWYLTEMENETTNNSNS